jgi:hypothetical protein
MRCRRLQIFVIISGEKAGPLREFRRGSWVPAGPLAGGGYIEARLPFEFVANFALALDHENAVQARPVVALLQPADIGRVENGENIAEVTMRARAVAKAAEPAQMLEFLLAELGDIGPECP